MENNMKKQNVVMGIIIMGMAFGVSAKATSDQVEKKLSYNISVIQESVSEDNLPLVTGTGVYNSSSSLVNFKKLLSSKKSHLVFSSSSEIPADKDYIFAMKTPHKEGYVKSVSVTNKQDPKYGLMTETTTTMDYNLFDQSISLVINPKSEPFFAVSLEQSYLNNLDTSGAVGLVNVNNWSTKSKVFIQDEQILRIDSSVYQIDNKPYKNIYLVKVSK